MGEGGDEEMAQVSSYQFGSFRRRHGDLEN